MDRVFRFAIDLLAGLVGVLSGLYFLFSGASSLVRFVAIYPLFFGGGSDPRMRVAHELLKGNGQLPDDMSFLLLPLGLTVVMLLAGAGLLFLGGRGIVRRLAAGLPSDDEGRAKTEIGRWLSTGVFLFGIGIAGAGIIGGILNGQERFAIVFFGVDVTAEVLELEKDPATAGDRHPRYMLTFSYPGPEGETIEVNERINDTAARYFRDNSQFGLRYSARAPGQFELIDFATTPLGYVWFFLWRIAFVYVGLCGIQRNLRTDPTPPPRGRDSYSGKSPAARASIAPLPAGKRQQFGRKRT